MMPIALTKAEHRLLSMVHVEAEQLRAEARRFLGRAAQHVNEAIADVLDSHAIAIPSTGRPHLDLEARTLMWEEAPAPEPAKGEDS